MLLLIITYIGDNAEERQIQKQHLLLLIRDLLNIIEGLNNIQKQHLLLLIKNLSRKTQPGGIIQKQHLLLLIRYFRYTGNKIIKIQKQHLLLLILRKERGGLYMLENSKTTFVTVNHIN